MPKTHQAPADVRSLMVERLGSLDNCPYPTISSVQTQAIEALTLTEADSQAPAIVEEAPQQYELRPYQQRALLKIKQAIADGFRTIMIQAPTGSGKGVILAHIIKICHQQGRNVLFVVHRHEILCQLSYYLKKYGIDHGIIKAGVKHNYHHDVQLATFQTIHRRINNPYIRQADVVIVDEAHHTTAETYLSVVNKFMTKLVLGFSATPARKSGLGLGNFFDRLIQVATIQELIDLGFLAPMRVYAPVKPNLKGVKIIGGDYNPKQLETAMMNSGVVKDIVGHWQKYGKNRKTMVFATGVKHSIALCNKFREAGITATHVDSKTDKDVREDILKQFKTGAIQVIVNCMIYTEGVDVPDIGCILLARPTKSLVMYMQMVGRGMRAVEGKTDCILLDHAGSVYEHGFPDEITEWELSTDSTNVNKKNEQRKKRGSEPISCPVCNLLYTGQLQCPGCGNVPTIMQMGKDIEYVIDHVLGEIIRKPKKLQVPVRIYDQMQASWYQQLQLYCKQKGHKYKWIDYVFQARFGGSPPKVFRNLQPSTTLSPEVAMFIRQYNLEYAMSFKKAA